MTVTGKGDNARYDIQKHQSDNEVLLASVHQDSGTNSAAWDIFFWWNVCPRLNTQKYHLYKKVYISDSQYNVYTSIRIIYIYTHIFVDLHTHTNRYNTYSRRHWLQIFHQFHGDHPPRSLQSSENLQFQPLAGGWTAGLPGTRALLTVPRTRTSSYVSWVVPRRVLGVKDFQSRWGVSSRSLQ